MPNTPSTAERVAQQARKHEQAEQERADVTPDETRRRRPGRPGQDKGIVGGTTVRAPALDLFLPQIREPKEKDLIALFEFEHLEKIGERPNYKSLVKMRNQLVRNVLKVESIFFGGETGYLGMVLKPEIFDNKPATSRGASPNCRECSPVSPLGLLMRTK